MPSGTNCSGTASATSIVSRGTESLLTLRWRKRDSNFESVQGNWLYPDIDPTSAPGAADQKIATLGSNFARVFDPFKRPFPAEN